MRGWTMSRLARRTLAATGMAVVMTAVSAQEARAHCDTMDGPVVTAARHALESDSLHHVLMWVRPQDEREIEHAFHHARSVRRLGGEARDLADRYFFETVVRVHREGEGEPYTGLKPAGTDHGPAIPAADRALATKDVAALERLLVDALRHAVQERFDRAVKAKDFAAGDVDAGRRFVAAYVELLHFVEHGYELAAGAGHAGPTPATSSAADHSAHDARPAAAPAHHDGRP